MTIEAEFFTLLEKDATGEYEFDFTFRETAQVQVSVLDSGDFQQGMVLQEGTDYRVIRTSSDKGGIIQIFDQAAIEERYATLTGLVFNYLYIERFIAVAQPVVIGDGYSRNILDYALTRLSMVDQQLNADLTNLKSVEGIYDPQGSINEPNERGRSVIIDNDRAKNKFKGANLIQNESTGNIEIRDGGGSLKDIVALNAEIVDDVSSTTVTTTAITATRGEITDVISNIVSTRILELLDGAGGTSLTAQNASLDISFNLQGAGGAKLYTVTAVVTGNTATLGLAEYGINPIPEPVLPNSLAIVVDQNTVRSSRYTLESDSELVFTNNKTLTFRDANDAAFVMYTVSGRPYYLKLLLDPAVNLLPETEAELYLTISGINIEGRLRQNTRFNGIVANQYIPVCTNEGARELTNSYMRHEVDSNYRSSVSTTFDSYHTFRNYSNKLRGGIGAHTDSAFKVMLFKHDTVTPVGANFYIESESSPFTISSIGGTESGTALTVKTTPYFWDASRNALILPVGATIGFQTADGVTLFSAGGDQGKVKLTAYSPQSTTHFLGYDLATDSYTNKTPSGSGGGSGNVTTGTPWQVGRLVTAQTTTSIDTISIKNSNVRTPSITGSLDFDVPNAGIYFNADTQATPLFIKVGVATGSKLDIVFDTSAWLDGQGLYYDGVSKTIKTKSVSSGGTGGNGNATQDTYMVAGPDNTPRTGALKHDGFQTLSAQPITLIDSTLAFKKGDSSVTYLDTVARAGNTKVLIDPNIELLGIGATTYAGFRRLNSNTLVLEISKEELADIRVQSPYPSVPSMAVWLGHESTYDDVVIAHTPIEQSNNRKQNVIHRTRVIKKGGCFNQRVSPTGGNVILDTDNYGAHIIELLGNIATWTTTSPFPDGIRPITIIFLNAATISYPSDWLFNCAVPTSGVADSQFQITLNVIAGKIYCALTGNTVFTSPRLGLRVFPPYPAVPCMALFITGNGRALQSANVPQTGSKKSVKHKGKKIVKKGTLATEFVAVVSGEIRLDFYNYSSHVVNVTADVTAWYVPSTYIPNSVHMVTFNFAADATLTMPTQLWTNVKLGHSYARGTELTLQVIPINSSKWLGAYSGIVFNKPAISLQTVAPYPTTGAALAIWRSAIARHIGGVLPIFQTGNTRRKVIHRTKITKAIFLKQQTVTIDASGLLNINIVPSGACSFVFTHDRDVTGFTITIDPSMQTKTFSILITRKGGTAMAFPRLIGYYAVNDGTIPFGSLYNDQFVIEHMGNGQKRVHYIFNKTS